MALHNIQAWHLVRPKVGGGRSFESGCPFKGGRSFTRQCEYIYMYDQFLNRLACFQLYKVKWSRLETRPKGLKAGRTAWKLAGWYTSSLNGMKAVQACQTNGPWPGWHESCTSLPNKWPVAWMAWKLAKLFLEHTSNIVSQARPPAPVRYWNRSALALVGSCLRD